MSAEIHQAQMEDEVKTLNNLQKDMKKLMESSQQLLEQENETNLVKREIDLLESDAKVYKLIGPCLMRQDTAEVKTNIAKRLEYIHNETKKVQIILKDNEQKQIASRNKLTKIQENFQRLVKEKQGQQQ